MRMLVADDEDYTREGLVEGVGWQDYGINEILQARDGSAALGIARWFRPDIILTDIRMPKMDGIEFAREMLQLNPDCIVIFMSGYLEIEYLKSAIELSAVAFVEKPISIRQVTEAVEKAVMEVNRKKKNKRLSLDNLDFKKQKLANTLICKDIAKDMILPMCREIGFPTGEEYNCLILWDKDGMTNNDDLMKDIPAWFMERNIFCLCGFLEAKISIAITAYKNMDRRAVDAAHQSFALAWPKLVTGVGFLVSDLMNISSSYATARIALNYAFYDEECHYFEVDEHALLQQTLEPGLSSEFMQVYKTTPYKMEEWIHQLVSRFADRRYYQKEQVILLFQSFAGNVLQDHPDYFDLSGCAGNAEDYLLSMKHAKSIYELEQRMYDLTYFLIQKLDRNSKYSKVINDTIDFIAKNYQNSDLSIQEIADHMRLSATHLNVLFRQEMKVTLKQYVSNLRMSKALQLLEAEHFNVTEVAERCGYANANYFAKVFKETYQMTPLEYKKQTI